MNRSSALLASAAEAIARRRTPRCDCRLLNLETPASSDRTRTLSSSSSARRDGPDGASGRGGRRQPRRPREGPPRRRREEDPTDALSPPRRLEPSHLTRLLREALIEGRRLDGALSRVPRRGGPSRGDLADAASRVLRRPDLFSSSSSSSEGEAAAGLLPWECFPLGEDDWSGDSKFRSAEGWISGAAEEVARRTWNGRSSDAEGGDDDDGDGAEAAFPADMMREWTDAWGRTRASELARTLSASPPVAVRVGRRRDVGAVVESLSSELGREFRPSRTSPVGFLCDDYAPVAGSSAHEGGLCAVQDAGSQLLSLFALWPERFAPFLSPSPGETPTPASEAIPLPRWSKKGLKVVDACAGAGGKSLAMADLLGGQGKVFAYDVAPWKLKRLRKRAKATDLRNIQTVEVKDGDELSSIPPKHLGSADIVLVDAPCSGWGTLRRNPDLKFRQTAKEREHLAELQLRLLRVYAPLVRPGGRLVYGTCTFRPEETRDVVARFLADADAADGGGESGGRSGGDFSAGEEGYLGPSPEADGFFMASLTKLQ